MDGWWSGLLEPNFNNQQDRQSAHLFGSSAGSQLSRVSKRPTMFKYCLDGPHSWASFGCFTRSKDVRIVMFSSWNTPYTSPSRTLPFASLTTGWRSGPFNDLYLRTSPPPHSKKTELHGAFAGRTVPHLRLWHRLCTPNAMREEVPQVIAAT